MQRFARTEGVLIEPLGELWAVFSPSTGETALLNDESVAILEVLEAGAAGTEAVCSSLAEDSGIDAASLFDTVHGCWGKLIEAGLVHEVAPFGAAHW
jgi:PqqD family protein of HPr-rel-A system